jgi:hypothetical protein
MDSWTSHKLRKCMKVHKLAGRSKPCTKNQMITFIQNTLPLNKLDAMLCAVGSCYPLKSVLPLEVVIHIKRFIEAEKHWWHTLSLPDLSKLWKVVVMTTPPSSMTRHSLVEVLASFISSLEEAQNLLARIQTQEMFMDPRRSWTLSTHELIPLRHVYIKKHVDVAGARFLLSLPEDVLRYEVRMFCRHSSVVSDKLGLIKMYMKSNYPNQDTRSMIRSSMSF